MLARLEVAREQLGRFAANPEDRNPLDYAVISIWTVAGYAINVLLEIDGRKPEQRHQTNERASELRALGKLQGDYEKILAQLESYRLTAEHSGYSKHASVHYSRKNVH